MTVSVLVCDDGLDAVGQAARRQPDASHVGRLLGKLGVASRVQAVIYAYETGIVEARRPRGPSSCRS